MRFVVGLVLGLLLGFAVARFALGRATPVAFTSKEPIALSASEGNAVGVIPVGQPVIALQSQVFEPDVGWWGCVPVLFGNGYLVSKLLDSNSQHRWKWDSGPAVFAEERGELLARISHQRRDEGRFP